MLKTNRKKAQYTAVGSYAGIGGMLTPLFSSKLKWFVEGNHENRKIHTYKDADGNNTFETNFSAPNWEGGIPESVREPMLLAAQPKCGGFSSLYGTSRKDGDKMKGMESYGPMIIETMEDIAQCKPEVFFMDNLAKSLLVVPAEKWHEIIPPEYTIQFEWVSNYHYGNPQKARNRLFVIGSRNGFRFTPREVLPRGDTMEERIGDLLDVKWGSIPNHDKHSRKDGDGITNLADSNTWKDIAKYILHSVPEGKNLGYLAKDGKIKSRIGSTKMYWDKHAHTLAGVKGAKFHPAHGYPLSIRERCRLQGYPDDFIIYGTRFMEDGTWSLRKNSYPVRQLNNTVPAEFCAELIDQLEYFLIHEKNKFKRKDAVRAIKPNPLITDANLRMAELRKGGN